MVKFIEGHHCNLPKTEINKKYVLNVIVAAGVLGCLFVCFTSVKIKIRLF